ncbi:hypothetical protein [Streptacidiphilus sp. EB129]|uniref:hypothetical protein n=1 Tax=Streptacidiphilus sp. EB129 TaxID=3156262 RepID=UPI003510FB5C
MSLLTRVAEVFAPGNGSRRSTAVTPQRATVPCNLTEVLCSASKAEHPAWWTTEVPGDCPWCLAESLADQVHRLTLDLEFYRPQLTHDDTLLMQAAADDPESCFSQPDPAPAADGPRISDVPAPPVSEAAPVEEETVATDVTRLRALGIDTGMRPPLPGEITQALPIVTAVLPLWSNPTPVSLGTGDRAHESVAAVVGGDL